MKLKILSDFPVGMAELPPEELWTLFDGPCLVDIAQKGKPYVFISVMLHGNEPTGIRVIQKLIKKYKRNMDKSLLVLIGNVNAAREKVRFLWDQPDYNRIWNGGEIPEEKWASEVLDYVFSKKPMWGLDIHNNTGKNPLYACINHLHEELFRLSGAFSDKVVYFETPVEALGVALSREFPAITLECGQASELDGVEKTFKYVEKLLTLNSLDELAYNPNYKLYEVEAVIKVRKSLDIFIGNSANENSVCFLPHLEELNFNLASKGSVIGRSTEVTSPLTIEGVNSDCLHDDFLSYKKGELQLLKDVVPSMISLNPTIIRQDCLGYFMMKKAI